MLRSNQVRQFNVLMTDIDWMYGLARTERALSAQMFAA